MEVGHRLEALLPAQVRVDGVALDRAGPDDRDLHDEVVEAGRAALRERLHLGPALDLEDAHGVGRLEHLEDLGDLLGQPVEIDAGRAVALDPLEGLVDRGEHPEAEQVELDELDRLDVALVVLDDDPVLHRRPLERGDVDERGGGDEHPAAVDAEVAREAVHPGAQLEPALPVRQPDEAPATRLGREARARPGRRSSGRRGRRSVPASAALGVGSGPCRLRSVARRRSVPGLRSVRSGLGRVRGVGSGPGQLRGPVGGAGAAGIPVERPPEPIRPSLRRQEHA